MTDAVVLWIFTNLNISKTIKSADLTLQGLGHTTVHHGCLGFNHLTRKLIPNIYDKKMHNS